MTRWLVALGCSALFFGCAGEIHSPGPAPDPASGQLAYDGECIASCLREGGTATTCESACDREAERTEDGEPPPTDFSDGAGEPRAPGEEEPGPVEDPTSTDDGRGGSGSDGSSGDGSGSDGSGGSSDEEGYDDGYGGDGYDDGYYDDGYGDDGYDDGYGDDGWEEV